MLSSPIISFNAFGGVEFLTILECCQIRGPVVIGEDVLIKNSFIGPFTSIGHRSKIINASLEHCVLLDEVEVINIERLEDALIGYLLPEKKEAILPAH